jgi:hypothetical protein
VHGKPRQSNATASIASHTCAVCLGACSMLFIVYVLQPAAAAQSVCQHVAHDRKQTMLFLNDPWWLPRLHADARH